MIVAVYNKVHYAEVSTQNEILKLLHNFIILAVFDHWNK